MSYGDTKETGGIDDVVTSDKNMVLTSGAESEEIKKKFVDAGWEVTSVPGAGHKLLKVSLGEYNEM